MEKKALFTIDLSLLMMGYAFAVTGNHALSFTAACASLLMALISRGFDRLSRALPGIVIISTLQIAAAWLFRLPQLMSGVCVCIYSGVCVSALWIDEYRENSSVYHLLMAAMTAFAFAAMFIPHESLPFSSVMCLVIVIFLPFTSSYVVRCLQESSVVTSIGTNE